MSMLQSKYELVQVGWVLYVNEYEKKDQLIDVPQDVHVWQPVNVEEAKTDDDKDDAGGFRDFKDDTAGVFLVMSVDLEGMWLDDDIGCLEGQAGFDWTDEMGW